MKKFIALLCLINYVVLFSKAVDTTDEIHSSQSVLANKIVTLLKNNREALADGTEQLPPLEPANFENLFKGWVEDSLTAELSSATVSGITSFDNIELTLLDNGVFVFYLHIPQLSLTGTLKNQYNNGFRASVSDVQFIATGHVVDRTNPQIALSLEEVHVNLNVNGNSTVKVTGLTPNVLNNYYSVILSQQLKNILNNKSDYYEDTVKNAFVEYVNKGLNGQSYDTFVNYILSLP